jgi:hypothetical protein
MSMKPVADKLREDGHLYVDNPRGHVWKLDEDGEIDYFGYDGDVHNGPLCVNCGYGFCHHCVRGPEHDCPSLGKLGG